MKDIYEKQLIKLYDIHSVDAGGLWKIYTDEAAMEPLLLKDYQHIMKLPRCCR